MSEGKNSNESSIINEFFEELNELKKANHELRKAYNKAVEEKIRNYIGVPRKEEIIDIDCEIIETLALPSGSEAHERRRET